MREREDTKDTRSTASDRMRGVFSIDRGVCFALFAYDVGFAIDLDEAQRRIAQGTQRENSICPVYTCCPRSR